MLSLCIIFIGVILLHADFSAWLDCKTVGFFLKISKEIGRAWRKSLTRETREPYTPCTLIPNPVSLSLAVRFQPRSRPFV